MHGSPPHEMSAALVHAVEGIMQTSRLKRRDRHKNKFSKSVPKLSLQVELRLLADVAQHLRQTLLIVSTARSLP
jgi:hypothetical protein